MSSESIVQQLYRSIMQEHRHPDDVARLEVHGNRVVGSHLVPGLTVEADETDDGIEAEIVVQEGAVIPKPVQMCFGLLPEKGLQHIVIRAHIHPEARVDVIAHCTFPNAVEVEHRMDAEIVVEEGA
mgnify:CR=1 FL=1